MEMDKMNEKKALFLPFMKIASGHHHVANTLMSELSKCQRKIDGYKVDILSYSYGKVETLVSSTYVAWIKYFPKFYNWLYVQMSYKETVRSRNFLYETLFTYAFKRLMEEKNPSILFFTHSLPSNIASRLRQKNKLNVITVNVYTDFFVNRLWGIEGIDFHFVPSMTVKNYLLEKGVSENRIYITGIPVDPIFKSSPHSTKSKDKLCMLVSGGNLGMVAMDELLLTDHKNHNVHYFVLSGKNIQLYEQLLRINHPSITPLPYIECKHQMNQLYNDVDGVITKPGGVTVSECLMKKKPLFIYEPLPGQEKINKDQLRRLGLAIPIDFKKESLEKQLFDFFDYETKKKTYQKRVNIFHQQLEKRPLHVIIEEILEQN